MMTYALNILDLALTLHAIKHGAVELNPLMRNIPVMVFFKVFVVGLLCLFLDSRPEPLARLGLRIGTVVYAAVNIWHIVNIAAAWLA